MEALVNLIKPILQIFITPKCMDTYFTAFDFFNGDCFKSTLSKGLGFGIIIGSILVKLPQILKIIQNKSGVGINLLSVTLDLSVITIYMAYNFVKAFPFTAWGDSFFLAIQTSLIGVLVLFYGGKVPQSFVYLSIYLIITFILISGITPVDVLWTLQGFSIPILVVGKLLQAYTNYKNGSTGQLSAVTLILLFLGAAARVFTSIQETGDNVVIMTHVTSAFVNGIIVTQLLYYWNVDIEAKVQAEKKKIK